MDKIPLSQGEYTTVDQDVFEWARKIRWCCYKNPYNKYAVRDNNFRLERLHHYIVGFPLNGNQVDHINGNGLDNRRINLRIVTPRENYSNRKERRLGKTSSKHVGVSYHKNTTDRVWQAQIVVNRKKLSLGYFLTEDEASRAYQNYLWKIK